MVSIRTVEYHLRHIFIRLGVRSRVEAAACFRQRNCASSGNPGRGAPCGRPGQILLGRLAGRYPAAGRSEHAAATAGCRRLTAHPAPAQIRPGRGPHAG